MSTPRRSLRLVLAAVLATAALGATQLHDESPAPAPSVASSGAGSSLGHPSSGSAPQAEPTSRTPRGLPPSAAKAARRADSGLLRGVTAPPPGKGREGHEEDEVTNGESSNGTSTKQLTYRGGAVQTAPRIYLVLWGPSWSTTAGDPHGVANRLHYFYQGVGGSSWASVLKQFSSNYGSFGNLTGQYRGWLADTTPVPAQPTKADIVAAAKRAATRQNDFSWNAQYVVATPWGVVDQYSTANRFCGWHNYTYAGPTGNWITYTSLPYMPYMDALGRGCGGKSVNGASGVLDGVTILAGHEYAETVNDPSLNAWADADGSENGDKCSWVNVANRTFANGLVFPVQPYWSNIWRSQYGYGCYFG